MEEHNPDIKQNIFEQNIGYIKSGKTEKKAQQNVIISGERLIYLSAFTVRINLDDDPDGIDHPWHVA
jgi:hypothetical protein